MENMHLSLKVITRTLVPIFVVVLFLFQNLHDKLIIETKQNYINKEQKQLDNISMQISIIMNNAKNIVNILSTIESEDINNIDKIKEQYEVIIKAVPTVNELNLFSTDKKNLISTHKHKIYRNNINNNTNPCDNFFEKVLKAEILYLCDIYYSQDTNELTAKVAKKVIDTKYGKTIGVITAEISLSTIDNIIIDHLKDINGIVFVNKNTQEFIYKSSLSNRFSEKLFLNAKKNEIYSEAIDDEQYTIVGNRYKDMDMDMDVSFYFIMKNTQIFKTLNNNIQKNYQLFFISIIIITLLTIFIIEKLFTPLVRLIEQIKTDSKKIDARFLSDEEDDKNEILQIKKYFEQYKQIIANERKKLEELNKDLEKRVEIEVKNNIENQALLFQQSKLASMGEMIGNIAHQWRQPLSTISMFSANMRASVELEEKLLDEDVIDYTKKIETQCQYLSKTIDDFRNFFAPNKRKNKFAIKHSIDITLELVAASFKTHEIKLIEDIEDIQTYGLENELTQAILNIIKNAKDILVTLQNTRRLIFIKAYENNKMAFIEITDSGGGIQEDILDKIFEPYFTTKDKNQGTGIGLYMTETIITKHLAGKMSVENVEYEHEGEQYKGAKFTIEIPLNDDDSKER